MISLRLRLLLILAHLVRPPFRPASFVSMSMGYIIHVALRQCTRALYRARELYRALGPQGAEFYETTMSKMLNRIGPYDRSNQGAHLEYQCDCGTKLQCDVPMVSGGSLPAGGFAVNMGPPHACIHEDRFDASARVPILVV